MDSNFFRQKIIVPKLYLKLEFDTEDQGLSKKKLVTLISFCDSWIEFKKWVKGKFEKNQFVWSFWCYFENLLNRRGISYFGRAESMYVDAQFSKAFCSSYFH